MIDKNIIEQSIADCVTFTDLGLDNKYTGKVRDTYDLGDNLVDCNHRPTKCV